MRNIPELLPVKTAAKQLKVSEQHVRGLLREGKLTGKMIGTQWLISNVAIKAYLSPKKKNDVVLDHPRKGKKLPDLKALSFFSGAMGLDLGLEKAGIDVLLACENDQACRKTIEENKPDLALIGDIWNYTNGPKF